MTKINEDDLFSVLPTLPKGKWPSSVNDFDNYKIAANRFADRYKIELNQIIEGKLSKEDFITYSYLIELNLDMLLYILFKKDCVEGTDTLAGYRNYKQPINTGGTFPWFSPAYNFLKSKIPDIWEIGQTLRKDIANDFPI